ncbi:PIG-L deacetylase family protein [Rhodanobacter ginsengisoli]|uniref:PIG-L deacetylase family protein n=1 Tax=Rhodanobacter ginsengisoli TaxID=418646 RepID=A0ABW0QKK1_9GAMM
MAVTPQRGLPAFSAQTRLLVVAPHPDDETIATGLLIQQVQAAGGEVRILLLTAGDNNPWPQRWLERRLWIGAADRQRWGRRRHAEILQALACLGVPPQSLQLLGWPDLGVTGMLLRSGSDAVPTLAAAIEQFQPSLLAMPSLDDRHPDHGSAHVLVRLALAGRATRPTLLAYLVHGHDPGTSPLEIHATDGQLANKRAALAAHRSQMALSGKRMHRLAARPERYAVVSETAEGSTASLPWQPWAWVRPWLRLSVVSPTGAQTWRWRDAPLQRDRSGSFQLSLPVAATACPGFARLAFTLPSLWIFDHWGWCALSGCRPSP